ncbi:hypothetical protein [Anaplasma phagocytophilum]|uniref:hypothetical protein n=1 Tax=Anaplasma phagocytophilum TaxID=948 RepID=UPI00200DCEF4|nr:hypothetical protein [Anaplasma phagocytophilum]UQD54533.1 hypothetical protein ESP60_04380 [Anaplasma phagocytophilum]UQD54535.1 hypothetical protein ESP60_04395 [Anaplasma phagocytophilum]
MYDRDLIKGAIASQGALFRTAYRCSGYASSYLRHVSAYAVASAYQSVYPMLFTARFAYRKTKRTLTNVTYWLNFFAGLVLVYFRIFEVFGFSPYRPEDLRKMVIITAVLVLAFVLGTLVIALFSFPLHFVAGAFFLFQLCTYVDFVTRLILQIFKIIGKGLVEVCAILAASIPCMLACVLALYSAALAIPSLLISLPFMLLHSTLLTVGSSMRSVTSLTLEFIRSTYRATAEWIRNVRPGTALLFLWKMLKSLLLACLCLGTHPVDEDNLSLVASSSESGNQRTQCGFFRNVIAVSVGAVVAVVAGVFSIAATLVSLLALPIVLLGFTLFHHPDVSCDRERSPRTGRLAICFDTSNVPPEPHNPEFIQRIATYVVTAANTAQSRQPTPTQPANEDPNMAAGAQIPGIGERVQRAISVIAQAFSSSNTRSDTGIPSAICFGVESVSQGLATDPLQRC